MITAKWERGFESFYRGIDANEVAQEIVSIGDDATPQQIVDKARDKKTQLHRCFTWDNKVAAEQWRKQEARLLVGHLMILDQIVNIINLAGFGLGIGSGRTSGYGRYHVTDVK